MVDLQNLPSIIEGEVARSIGNWNGSLSEARTRQFEYYYGAPFGNEVEGESQVVSTDVADTIEGILPIILEIFTKSDDVVRFDPNGPEDEEQAKQQTEVANYVFYRQNNGFLVLYQWFKDALIQNNGVVKYWWDEKTTNTKEEYKGLTDQEYQTLMNDDYIEIKEEKHEEYDDPTALQQLEQMKAQIEAQPIPEEQKAMMLMQLPPVPKLHDVVVRIKKDVSKICIEAIPPEEFGISAQHNCVSIQDTPFCYHRTKKTISQLREMDCPEEILLEAAPANEPDITPEALARDRFLEVRDGPEMLDKEVWVTDCYIRVDFDGDGVAELRHVIMVGRSIWVNDECDHINFAAVTPIIMPHRWIGRSVAELVMDIQFTKSVIWRQMLNNLYLTNNPRKAVLSSAAGIVQANLDDLLVSRPGGIMREYVQGAIRNEEVPFVAGASFPMLEYMDSIKETRTGVTRYNQGTDADTLNKTARGIQMIQAAGQQRTALIARILAETGVKDLMRGLVYMLSKYSTKAMTIKLRNKWVNIDPREWKTQYNMTINVGLGTGNRDVQIAQLQGIHQQQIELMQTGRGYMVSDENIYALYRKMAEAMGFKHPELFITDPQNVPPQAKQPPPNPDLIKIQAEAQKDASKLQLDQQKLQVDSRLQEMLEQIKAQTAISVATIQAETQMKIAQMKISADAQLAVFDAEQNQGDPELKKAEAIGKLTLDRAVATEKAKLEREKAEADIQLRAAELQQKALLDQQAMEQKAALEKEKAAKKQEQETRDKKGDGIQQAVSAMAVMHKDIMGVAAKALGKEKKGKKKISFIEKDGKVVGAEVED